MSNNAISQVQGIVIASAVIVIIVIAASAYWALTVPSEITTVTETRTTTVSQTTTITSTVTTTVTSTLDFTNCEGFLDEPPPNLVLSTMDVTETAKKDNPNIVSMCLASYQTIDGFKGITLTVIKFDSVSAADVHFETALDSLRESAGDQLTEGVIGPKSYKVVVNTAGVGSFVGFQKGVVLCSFHTAMPEGETPLADSDQLVDMAQLVEERLP